MDETIAILLILFWVTLVCFLMLRSRPKMIEDRAKAQREEYARQFAARRAPTIDTTKVFIMKDES